MSTPDFYILTKSYDKNIRTDYKPENSIRQKINYEGILNVFNFPHTVNIR